MKSFATFFTALTAVVITTLSAVPASAQQPAFVQIEQSIGKADNVILEAQAQKEESKPDLIIGGRTVVTSDFGGSVGEYVRKYNSWQLEQRKVVVADDCMSACTFMLGRLDAANVCVTPHAQFAFHSAYQMSFAGPTFAKEATRLMWQYYPEQVKVKLREAGWASGEVEHPDFIYIKASEFYELCN